jgi:hypothetical protein
MARTLQAPHAAAFVVACCAAFLMVAIEPTDPPEPSIPEDGLPAASEATETAGPGFSVTGSLTVSLAPGVIADLDLLVRNPTDSDLRVHDLTVTITEVDAPNATPELPCSIADFDVRQARGDLLLPAAGASTLSQAGWPRDRMPAIAMIAAPDNQDGCKGATLDLRHDALGDSE